MSLRCKPGQMCRVIKAQLPENVGLIVETLKIDKLSARNWPMWIVKPAWPVRGIDRATQKVRHTFDAESYVPDAWLQPIEPPATPEVEETEEELTV